MALKKPKKPKQKSFPKQPKKSAPLSTWKRYYERKKDIQKENDERMKQYNKDVAEYNRQLSQKQKLIDAAKKMPKYSVKAKQLA